VPCRYRKWMGTGLDLVGAWIGYLVASRAKAAAATLSATALGASAIVSAARAAGLDSMAVALTVVSAADEAGHADTEAEPDADAALDSRWHQIRLALICLGLLYQLVSASRLPLLVRLLLWPLLLLEGALKAVSDRNAYLAATQPAPPAANATATRAGKTATKAATAAAANTATTSASGDSGRSRASPGRARPKVE
jgi:hypothetical protein